MIDENKLKQVEEIELVNLEFDQNNPRFGAEVGKITNQVEILDLIVDEYGIDDVLSSLAVNGYFSAEPIIVRRNQPVLTKQKQNKDEVPETSEATETIKYTVAEGNRRLAACLILAGDPRAKNQSKKRSLIQNSLVHPIETKIPAIVYDEHEDEKEIISYLGVRHIAASQPWDSFAKAAWVAKVIDENNLNLSEVITMIGEKTGTISRMLEGFYFITQLIDSGKFNPEDSYRKGRGSNTKYPFSWVYTLLGSPVAKKFLGLTSEQPIKNPIPEEKLDDASTLIDALFGNSSSGRRPAIDDSRELGKLAAILGDREKVFHLERGDTVTEIERKFEPISDLLGNGLAECLGKLRHITSAIGEQKLSAEEAEKNIKMIIGVRKLSKDIHERLIKAMAGDTDLDDI